ncbi:DNA/RNA non-specific endonuclease [Rummeliibacillus sp. SL167]|uniref:DNA/RNA non-specific endonuclease n=1 Tax=Rummeliibacillus sp. SL167 TaxID=2579792 RepID=UPI0011B721A3|nr:DNA/RNA non-specific endonuclease [Rummeliibacillus sp. SL167]
MDSLAFQRDVINGDANSRAEWISYALGTLGLSAVGTKGLGAVTKTGMTTVKATAKVGVHKVKAAAQKISPLNLYPYAPQHQSAGVNAGIVPYNTVNSVGLRDQLISMAKMSGKGKDDISKQVKYREHFTKDNGKKALKPNIEYTTKEGYQYKTDGSGRISNVEAKLELGKAERNQYAQRTVGGEDRLSNDDGGHLIASIFKGSGEIDNLVPMNATLNRKEYKALETSWKKALEEGKEVTVRVKPIYKGKSSRPTEFKISYTIEGKKYSDRLTNYLGGK